MKNIIIFLFLIGLTGCIEPFDINTTEAEKMLVVNGLITNEKGPYKIKLNKSAPAATYFGAVDPTVNNATVIISDEQGNSEKLAMVKEGEYQTRANGIQGRIGGIYTLYIRLQDGQEYTSEPETLNPVADIDRLYFGVKEGIALDKDKNEIKKYDIEIKVDLKDPAVERNFYKWTSVGTYEVETQPENYTVTDRYGNVIPMPKPCCKQCWITRIDNTIYTLSDQQFNGNNKFGQVVTTIPVVPQYVGIKYHVALKQYSISEKIYNFWRVLDTQASGTGAVQDPAPAEVVGNMKSITNPDKKVLGFFGASAVKEKNIFVRNSELPFFAMRFEYPDDCQNLPVSTTIKPDFWE